MEFTKSKNSLLISFEGIEGSGKTTQIELLEKALKEKGFDVIKLREPGGTAFGEKLREAILQSDTKLSPISEAYLFASSRAQLLTEKIVPHLKKENTAVILDRYIDSSFAYQGIARGLGIETVQKIHEHFPLNIFPDLTFYLKISIQTSLARQEKRGNEKDYFEKEKSDFYSSLIQGFESCVDIYPNRVKTIDAEKSPSDVHLKIWSSLNERLQ